jgi:hypothetical protein
MTAMTEACFFDMYATPQLTLSPLGIRKAASWYHSHLSLSRPPVRGEVVQELPSVVLLTDDAANRQKAELDGISCASGMVVKLTKNQTLTNSNLSLKSEITWRICQMQAYS